MAKRKNPGKGPARRSQASKGRRGASRGQGSPHRPRDGAPRPIASGRGRTAKGVREHNWARREDEALEESAASERMRVGPSRERLEDSDRAGTFGAELAGAAARGTVLQVRRGHFLVELSAPPQMPEGSASPPACLRASPRGLLQHYDLGLASLVAAGDEVRLVVPPVQGAESFEAILTRVEPRKSEFRRLHPSGRAIQTLAANVTQVLIISSAAQPPFRPGFVDRVLACAASSALPAALVLNKMDLGLSASGEELLRVYRGLGVTVLRTSATEGLGLAALRALLAGKRSVLCGHSGVGKSSLLRALAPRLAAELRVAAVSTYTSKGKHTTTHARLYRLNGCEVIDTPGVREFTPADTDRRNLWGWFPEIKARQGQCAFSDCTHTVEKGCAILKAVAEGRIHPRRHESYVRIYRTLPA